MDLPNSSDRDDRENDHRGLSFLRSECVAITLGLLGRRDQRSTELQPWIDWFTFQSQDTEDALMNASQGFTTNESLQPFHTQCELS